MTAARSVIATFSVPTFAPAVDFPSGSGPNSVAIADLNGDGKADLVVANYDSNTVSVLLGDGTGSFGPKTDYPTGTNPYFVAIADLNGDGKADLVVANYGSNTVSILLGTGSGSFGPKTDFPTGSAPISVAIADINGDGKPDLVVANRYADSVSILLGTGSGSFGPKTDFPTGAYPRFLAVADLNGDGKLDLVVANDIPGTVSVLLGTGTGSFGPKTDFPTGTNPTSVAIADINGDGKPDLVVANAGAGTVSVLLGDGTGSFGPKTDYPTGSAPVSVAIADLNGDGKPDLVVANNSSSTVSVLLNTTVFSPSGSFAPAVDFPSGSGPHSVAIADLNGDGIPDLVDANGGDNTVSVLLGIGGGSFGPKTDYPTGAEPKSVAIADLNGDGKPDLVVANYGDNTVSVLLGDGTGSFGPKTDFPTGTAPTFVAIADLNGDGKPDLVVANYGDNTVSVLLNTTVFSPSGSFAPAVDFPSGSGPHSVAIADLNGDGIPDLVDANGGDNTVSVLLGTGSGSFGPKTDLPTGASPWSVAIADLNGDGKPDIAVANLYGNIVSVLLGDGTGSFGPKTDLPTGAEPGSVAIADVNGDGKLDLVVANRSDNTVSVLLGDGTGSFGPKTDFPTGTAPTFVAIADLNGDGKPDLVVANYGDNTVSVLLNTSSQATLSVSTTGNGSGTVTSSPAGITCGTTCSASFAYGTSVTLTATPATGSTFTGWSGDCTGTCTVSMTGAKSVTATFTLQTFSLTVTLAGTGSGSVSSSPGGIACGSTCSASFNYGTSVTLSAAPATGSIFTGWTGAGCSGTGTCTVSMTAAQSVTATFTLQTFSLTVTLAGTGSGSVSSSPGGIACGSTCSASFNYGTSVTLTATPASGSTFAGWSGDCTGTGPCNVSMTQARNVTATFLLVPPPPPGLILYDNFPGSAIEPGRWQTLEVVREIRSGRFVSSVRAGGPPPNLTNDLPFTNPAAIQTFQADVRINAYTSPPGGSSRVRLRGAYYNDGTTGPGATGDVRAHLFLRGIGTGVDIRYGVFKCADSDCTNSTDVIPSTTVKTAALGEVHTLAITWDGSVFTFAVDSVPTVVDPKPVQPIVHAVPNVPAKGLNTQLHFVGAGGMGAVAGDFDNVQVNGALYDDFSEAQLDPARWGSLDIVREVGGGTLVSKVAGTGAVGTKQHSRMRFVNQNAVTALQADVAVTAYQSANSTVQAALGGSFYNDGASTGPLDATGDIEGHIRVVSSSGAPLVAEFFVVRCGDPQCVTGTPLFSDTLGAVNLGETHTLLLVWNGSLFTYGMDGSFLAFDPKPSAPVAKPPTEHFKDLRTSAIVQATPAQPSIAATFGHVYVNTQAGTLPLLTPSFQQTVRGDVKSAGVGLRGTGAGTITLTGIPVGATVQHAFLYWATLGTAGTFTSPTLNGTPVSGSLLGQADDPFWGAFQSFAYRADVTSLVSGNGTYTVAGLPASGPTLNDSEGASLVVIYTLPGAPTRTITINDGAVMLAGGRVQFFATPLGGFVAANPPTGSSLTFVVGDGQAFTPEYAGLGVTLLATNDFSGSDGNFWDTKAYDVATALTPGQTSAAAVISTGNDALVWVAGVLSVPLETFPLTVTKAGTGTGVVTSSPAGITCGTTCSASFDFNTSVTLTATPAAHSTFSGWGGDCTGTGPCTVTMTQARNVTATFTALSFPLTVTRAGAGFGTISSSPAGIDCGGTCSAFFAPGASVTLTAAAASIPSSTFVGWSGACTGTGPCTVTMSQAQNVTATFARQSPSATLSLNQGSFSTGQTLILSAATAPGPTPVTADVYVALRLPNGSLLFLQAGGSVTAAPTPILQSWTVGAFSGQIFSYTFTGGEPAGGYVWLIALTTPGTTTFIGSIAVAPFFFSP